MDNPKVNAFCTVSCSNVLCPFLFTKKTYRNYLPGHAKEFLHANPQRKMTGAYIFQQVHNDVTSYLNVEVPVWIGHRGALYLGTFMITSGF
ncbi:hypothetical protein TNCV_3094811 [Trichonephila clavipes]|nr:hypothetical protein TNCV_3094811 [Trichonephila clavipes]